MTKTPEQMLAQTMREFQEQLDEANIDITKPTMFISGEGAVCVARFNSETQDEEEAFRSIIEALFGCCTEEGLHYAQKRINEIFAELEETR